MGVRSRLCDVRSDISQFFLEKNSMLTSYCEHIKASSTRGINNSIYSAEKDFSICIRLAFAMNRPQAISHKFFFFLI